LAGVHAALLAMALLLAQMLGVVHRVEHGTGTPPASAGVHVHGHDEHADHGMHGLFGSHSDAGECRLFDHASTADLVGFGLPSVYAPPAADAWLATGRCAPQRCAARCYQARAPPHRA